MKYFSFVIALLSVFPNQVFANENAIVRLMKNPKPDTASAGIAHYSSETQILEIPDFKIVSDTTETKVGSVKFKMIPIEGEESSYRMIIVK